MPLPPLGDGSIPRRLLGRSLRDVPTGGVCQVMGQGRCIAGGMVVDYIIAPKA